MKKNVGGFGFLIVLLIVFYLIASTMNTAPAKVKTKYSDVISYFEKAQVKDFVLEDNVLTYTLNDGTKAKYSLYSVDLFFKDLEPTLRAQRAAGTITYEMKSPMVMPWWFQFVPYLVILIVMGLVWFFMANQMSGGGGGGKAMNFGKARTRMASDDKRKTTFDDVAGADEEKEEMAEIVDFLKTPKKYIDLGARIPKGILLVGPPGTGKTLLARAVAGEAQVPFFTISGSDFVELYVGVGASRVRDLFETAKKSAPCIVFIDEIDAVGRQRGAGLGGGHDEREQTLNQLLVEMDGFGINEGVIIIAATNRADILDTALLRPGRFDRQILVSVPDIKGREQILVVHSKGKTMAPEVNLNTIAKGTTGFTGADLENVLNEAAIYAARRKKPLIDMKDIEDAIMKVIAGVEKKTRIVSEKDRKLTAFHEAGHAIVTRFLTTQDPVHQISIIPRGMAGGYTLSLPREDKSHMSKSEMNESIATLLGGRVAEKLALDDISTGASNDIERATTIARNMVTKYGMSDKLGPIVFGSGHDEVFLGRDFTSQRNFSEDIAASIDAEIKNIIITAYNKAEQILKDNFDKLTEVSNLLLEKEKIDGVEFESLFSDQPVEKEKQVDIFTGQEIKPE